MGLDKLSESVVRDDDLLARFERLMAQLEDAPGSTE